MENYNIETIDTLVSIIIPNYNGAQFIEQTINSVKNQTFKNWEIIIVDDGSTDNSYSIIKKYLCNNIKFYVRPDTILKGGNSCRNLGLKYAIGKYVIFLDSDDILAHFCIESRINYIKNHEDLDIAVFNMRNFHNNLNDGTIFTRLRTQKPFEHFLVIDNLWQTTSVLWKRDFLLSIGGFSEKYQRLQDIELTIRALLNNNIKYKLFYDSEPDSYYRTIPGGRTSNSSNKMKKGYLALIQLINEYHLNSTINSQYPNILPIITARLLFFHFLYFDFTDKTYYNNTIDKLFLLLKSDIHTLKILCFINNSNGIIKFCRHFPIKKIISFTYKNYIKYLINKHIS